MKELQSRLDMRRVERKMFTEDKGAAVEDDADSTYAHRETAREEAELLQRIFRLQSLIGSCTVVEPPTNTERLRIGHIATTQLFDEHSRPVGEPTKYLIGGFESSDPTATPPVLSYTSPRINGWLGKTIEDLEDVPPIHINGKVVYVHLLAIELPPT